jgi:anti-sigma B factor antagonist
MSIESKKENGVCHLTIKDEMTIYTAAQYKDELLSYFSDCHEMEIDLSEVTELDSAGLQILLLLESESAKTNKELHFIHHSQPVIEVIELLNLAAHFGDPLIIPAEWQEQ